MNTTINPPPQLSGIAIKILSAYKEWSNVLKHIPKMKRYSLGVKIDCLFSDLVELVSLAQFSAKENRTAFITRAISKNDCLKFMLYALLELNGIENKHFIRIAPIVEEIGKMLYGWKNQTEKPKENRQSFGNYQKVGGENKK